MTDELTTKAIQKVIYIIRKKKVMLDSDLASLYGVTTKVLNQAVKRNRDRFPVDFMFQISKEELHFLRSQIVTLRNSTSKRKYLPYLFTEHGIAMLSSVLNSEKAIQINIAIIRAFVKMRMKNTNDTSLIDKIEKLDKGTIEFRKGVDKVFRIIFERLDTLKQQLRFSRRKGRKLV